ncbi:hypothetical protein GDO81_026546 [Engystomops pustulosus]|uniref:Uncharacterized protein n=1 Tax=Engystomops pustulosus TaxID=76066 RepID=A0AAV6ZS38_ENGPU|nr:hypothetical protein GDO81_026546 [Engystomops pustulosus]
MKMVSPPCEFSDASQELISGQNFSHIQNMKICFYIWKCSSAKRDLILLPEIFQAVYVKLKDFHSVSDWMKVLGHRWCQWMDL